MWIIESNMKGFHMLCPQNNGLEGEASGLMASGLTGLPVIFFALKYH
jgi:hypothetical protein